MRRASWIAVVIIALFVALQAATLGYGTRINDLPHIRDYRVSGNVVAGSGLDRPQLLGTGTERRESIDLAMVRFKLYSVESDEVTNIIALARIQPRALRFDPGYYQYGGAYLYPLGAWYFLLSKLGVITVAPLEQMLAEPQRMDRIWIAGRAFVLAAVAASAFVLFVMLSEIASAGIALAALAIFLFCPATIMFSQVMKPHWYALLWVNAALLFTVRAFKHGALTRWQELGLAAAIGLAVGSASTFALFAALLWGALAYLAFKRSLPLATLIRIPTVAVLVFLLTNPYYLLNWPAVRAEQAATHGWFEPGYDPSAVLALIRTSLASGYGVALTAVMLVVAAWQLIRGSLAARLFAVALFAPIVVVAVLTASMSTWHFNFRYLPYLLPAALLFVAIHLQRLRGTIFAAMVATTIGQVAPMKLAYFDENSDAHSTRLAAAAWIDANIPRGDALCLSAIVLVPFDAPPFRFDERPVNTPDCRFTVRVERDTDAAAANPGQFIVKQFRPRLSPQRFPLVWGHINPQITIYHRSG